MKTTWLAILVASFFVLSCGTDAPGNAVLSGAGESCTKTADCESGLKCVALVCVAGAASDISADLGMDAVPADTVNDVTNDLPVAEVDANGDVAGVDACHPDCEGKNCGDDGCGETCGQCTEAQFCNGGACQNDCLSDEGCTQPGLSVCLDETSHHACVQVVSGCYHWGETESCEDGFVCANGGCVSPAVCGEVKPVVDGIVKNGVADMDFTGEEVSIQLYHKLDIDEWEDGCISRYIMEFSKMELGCKFHVEMNTSADAVFTVTSAILEADSFCPGWSDTDEGEYVLESSSLAMCSTVAVADYMTESACVPNVVVGFGGVLNLVRKTDGKELEVDLSGMTVTGDMISSGDTELVCPEPCALKECGGDGCGESCGECEKHETCRSGACGCAPACTDKKCGPDGCGGSCGGCPAGHICRMGECECSTSCAGRECGDDGCGGECGACPPGFRCAAGSCSLEQSVTLSERYPSHLVRASASSSRAPVAVGRRFLTYGPESLTDGDSESAWMKGGGGTNQTLWIQLDFDSEILLNEVRIWSGYQKERSDKAGDRFYRNDRPKDVRVLTSSGTRSFLLQDRKGPQSMELGGEKTTYVRIEIATVFRGLDSGCAVSELEVVRLVPQDSIVLPFARGRESGSGRICNSVEVELPKACDHDQQVFLGWFLAAFTREDWPKVESMTEIGVKTEPRDPSICHEDDCDPIPMTGFHDEAAGREAVRRLFNSAVEGCSIGDVLCSNERIELKVGDEAMVFVKRPPGYRLVDDFWWNND